MQVFPGDTVQQRNCEEHSPDNYILFLIMLLPQGKKGRSCQGVKYVFDAQRQRQVKD